MPRRARIHFNSLRSSLVNLPISIYGPLLERNIRPQGLAVHLSLVAESRSSRANVKIEAYVGWTGMASASSLAQFNASGPNEKGFETVEIDPQYAQGIGFTQGDLVEIGLLHDLSFATSVATEPVTSDDWEIIEIHAAHVESTLLSQVRVAKVGQEIDIWVLGRTRVRLRVVSVDPSTKGTAVLLTTNTEVSIAPKLHKQIDGTARSQVSKDTKTSATPSQPSSAPSKTTKGSSRITRVLPKRLLPHDAISKIDSYSGDLRTAYVSWVTFVRLRTGLKRLQPPVDPSSKPSTSSAAPSPPPPTVLTAGGGQEEDKTSHDQAKQEPEVYIAWLSEIPDDHIVFRILEDDIEEWDLTRFETTVLAGVDDIVEMCRTFCLQKFRAHAMVTSLPGVSGLLITGRTGAGKTSIVQVVAKSLQEDPKTYTYIHYIDLSRYTEKPIATLKALFRHAYEKAAWHKPSILIMDNLDKILSAELEHADSFRSRHLTELFLHQYSAASRMATPNFRGIVLIATASSATGLHPLISKSHIFEEEVHVKPPNKSARRDILSRIVEERLKTAVNLCQDPDARLNFTSLATQTEGYSAADLQDLVARAVHRVAIRAATDPDSVKLTIADFEAAQVDFTPLSLRDVKLQKSDVLWSDVGGKGHVYCLYETKRVLRETLEWPTKYGPIFAQSPLRLRSGIMLYGFPGCGKTLLASAVAKECGLNFISVKGPEILNKYIGASEQSVRELFERASAAKPCVLFFDEFDSIAPKRGHDSTGVTDRVVNQMLTQMDGAEGLDGVYVLAATSRPDMIDSALLRPGRLDKSLLCNMPNAGERKDILKAVAGKVKLAPSVNLDEIAEATEGYSGADLQALLYNAYLEVVHQAISNLPAADVPSNRDEAPIEYTIVGGPKEGSKVASKATEMALQRRLRQIQSTSTSRTNTQRAPPAAPKQHEITQEHLRSILKTSRPSVSPEEHQRLDRIYRDFIGDRSGDLPVPPDGVGIGNRVSLM
ncbi:AAA-domain-containing protein [Pleurotus eryngii]|uniref:Peroxisomal ATPase PEX1 n=1 Tax=Pleurotus eryngii TaxID=5323 RepID=A0A9P5ZZ48_PLEER|nr:AAA-domain-containing protein [Pleurotus eryngii]